MVVHKLAKARKKRNKKLLRADDDSTVWINWDTEPDGLTEDPRPDETAPHKVMPHTDGNDQPFSNPGPCSLGKCDPRARRYGQGSYSPVEHTDVESIASSSPEDKDKGSEGPPDLQMHRRPSDSFTPVPG